MLPQTVEDELIRLRLEDFERTELHKLRLEARAALPFTEPLTFLKIVYYATLSNLSSFVHHRPGERQNRSRDIRWHDCSSWYLRFWINLQPWLYWLTQYVTSILYGVIMHPVRAFDLLKLDWLSWLALSVLGPFLFVLTTVLGLLQVISPQASNWLNDLGTWLIIDDDLVLDVSTLSQTAKLQLGESSTNESQVVYHQSIAEFSLGISAVVYTRDQAVYAQAEELYKSLAAVPEELLPCKPFLSTSSGPVKKQFLDLFSKSESETRRLSSRLGLSSTTISELDSGYGGPIASMFWPEQMDQSFLILAIKGTSVFDAREWLIDTALQKVTASPEIFPFVSPKSCHVHQGFYTSLFPDCDEEFRSWLTHDLGDVYPAKHVLSALKIMASAIYKQTQKSVQLWITGHSLGASLATLMHARLSTIDLGPDLVLRDAYCYGTPMSTDASFVSAYHEFRTRKNMKGDVPAPRSSGICWRVINDDDFVTRLPINLNVARTNGGVGELDGKSTLFDNSILDYSSTGHGVKYGSKGKAVPLGLTPGQFDLTVEGDKRSPDIPASDWKTWLSRLRPLKDILEHSPKSYIKNMRLARNAVL